MDSCRALINRHIVQFPGTGFIAVDGQRMSSNDDNRLWDMLWRTFKARNTPSHDFLEADVFHEYPVLNFKRPREDARRALRKLVSWYRGVTSPHDAFADVHPHM